MMRRIDDRPDPDHAKERDDPMALLMRQLADRGFYVLGVVAPSPPKRALRSGPRHTGAPKPDA